MSEKTQTPNRFAEAQWSGSIKEGQGEISLGSGVFSGPFSFDTRFTVGDGTTPEELIAAAHAGCFTMATSAGLTAKGHAPESLHTKATVVLEMLTDGPTITGIHLEISGKVAGLTQEEFEAITTETKAKCPVSRALAGVPSITLKATLL
jgi:osmotically inducible protein OsmC